MKKMKILSVCLLGFVAVQLTLVACNSPKQRTEVIDKEIQPNVVTLKDVHDMTSNTTMAYFYKTTKVNEVGQMRQMQIDENVQKILAKVVKKENFAELSTHLDKGLISFIVFEDKITIYKVLKQDEAAKDLKAEQAKSLVEIRGLKKDLLDAKNMNSESISLEETTTDLKFIELTSIQIKTGVLDNKRTEFYDEKMSVLIVDERPLDLSTHILLGAEVGTDDNTSTEPKASS